ncbi:MAG: hypothetical protein ACREBU_03750 [Nitrososphaera sp.]
MIPIKTKEQFSKIIYAADGYVLITDDATGDKIHTPLCRTLTPQNFFEKVVSNKEKHGNYTWSDDFAELKDISPKATPCHVCRP